MTGRLCQPVPDIVRVMVPICAKDHAVSGCSPCFFYSVCMYMCMCAHVCIHLRAVCVFICARNDTMYYGVYIKVYMYIYINIYIYIYIYIYICIYIYIYIVVLDVLTI